MPKLEIGNTDLKLCQNYYRRYHCHYVSQKSLLVIIQYYITNNCFIFLKLYCLYSVCICTWIPGTNFSPTFTPKKNILPRKCKTILINKSDQILTWSGELDAPVKPVSTVPSSFALARDPAHHTQFLFGKKQHIRSRILPSALICINL